MKRNYKKEYYDGFKEAIEIAKEFQTAGDSIYFNCISKYGKSVFQKLNRVMYDNINLYYECGIISKAEQKILFDAYLIVENSIAEAIIL